MNQTSTLRTDYNPSFGTFAEPTTWHSLCRRSDLVAHSGVVAWHQGRQLAIFHLPVDAFGEERVFAIENRDPKSGANVIGRGLLGHLKGRLVVAAPLYKQHFCLDDGSCLEDPTQALQVWPARLHGDDVQIALD